MKLPDWLHVRSTRRTGQRSVTVTLFADTSAFDAAMREASVSLSRMAKAIRGVRIDGPAPLRRFADQVHIRAVAQDERAIARAYLDDLVDDAYACYGLTRKD